MNVGCAAKLSNEYFQFEQNRSVKNDERGKKDRRLNLHTVPGKSAMSFRRECLTHLWLGHVIRAVRKTLDVGTSILPNRCGRAPHEDSTQCFGSSRQSQDVIWSEMTKNLIDILEPQIPIIAMPFKSTNLIQDVKGHFATSFPVMFPSIS